MTPRFADRECRRCRKDFPSLRRTLRGRPLAYLDGPAGTQVPRQVIDAIAGYYTTCNANTHGEFVSSQETGRMIAEAREAAAAYLGAPSGGTISFGANMTTLCFSLSRALGRSLRPGDEIVITRLDHEANRGPWLALRERGVVVKEVGFCAESGLIDYADLERLVTRRTRIVAAGYASNALGTVNDIARFRKISKAAGALLAVDAVHHAAHFPIDVQAIGADFLLCSAYKFYGPHVGILYARKGLLDTLATDVLQTQEQRAPWRIETGTLNHAAICGVKAAIEYVARFGRGSNLREKILSARAAISAYEVGLARYYFEAVRKIKGVQTWGPDFSAVLRAPTVSITLKGIHSQTAAKNLGDRGLLVWNGHFYAQKAVEVLGLKKKGGLIRTGISMYNTKEEIERLLEEIGRMCLARK
jgi:cysteine desulfurase family protein (TIGR01976 family)